MDGIKVYENCEKKAAVIREKDLHTPWFATEFTFLFSDDTKFTSVEKKGDLNDDRYTRVLDPGYGYVKMN